jgi:ssDNA-binding replication factor A large subunit
MLSLEEIVGEISGKSGKGQDDVRRLIKDKQTELSGLVSEEGAAYIVGRELGVELIKDSKRDLKIGNVLPDMRAVDIVARITDVFEPMEFEKNGKKGRVCSMILADETGTIRLPLWNDEIKIMTSLKLKEDDVIEVSGAWAKIDNRSGGAELRLGKKGKIRKLEGKDAPEIKVAKARQRAEAPVLSAGQPERVDISDLQPNMNVMIKATIVQVYRKRPYYEVCPQCGGRVEDKGGKPECKEHGPVEPAKNLLLSAVIDDGTGNVRAVFFREQAEKVFGKSADEVCSGFDKLGVDEFWKGADMLGKEFMIEGRSKISDFTKENEILVNSVSEVDMKAECKRLMDKVKKK